MSENITVSVPLAPVISLPDKAGASLDVHTSNQGFAVSSSEKDSESTASSGWDSSVLCI